MLVEGRKWRFEANDEMHVELWVGALKIAPTGALRLIFADGEEYRWCTVSSPQLSMLTMRILRGAHFTLTFAGLTHRRSP